MVVERSIQKYRKHITEDFSFHDSFPYNANPSEPIHNWCLIPESPSSTWAKAIIQRFGGNSTFIFDPFVGSGTVALESLRSNKHFLGGDILPDLVIGTLAKVYASEIDSHLLGVYQKNLEGHIHEKVDSLSNLGALDEIGITFLTDLQAYALQHIKQRPYVFAVLAAIYQSIRDIKDDSTVGYWYLRYRNQQRKITNDLLSEDTLDISKTRSVCLGDSCKIDWQRYLMELPLPQKKCGVMITSCTYVDTAQAMNLSVVLCRRLGTLATQFLDLASKYVHEEENFRTHKFTKEFGIDDPSGEVNRYLDSLANVLQSFHNIADAPSSVIITNENPVINGIPAELDLCICKIAEDIGYRVGRVILTHYLKSPGTITKQETARRGAFIELHF